MVHYRTEWNSEVRFIINQLFSYQGILTTQNQQRMQLIVWYIYTHGEFVFWNAFLVYVIDILSETELSTQYC